MEFHRQRKALDLAGHKANNSTNTKRCKGNAAKRKAK
jgi:hypothetical protein